MKRFIAMLMTTCMVLSTVSISFASEVEEYVEETMDISDEIVAVDVVEENSRDAIIDSEILTSDAIDEAEEDILLEDEIDALDEILSDEVIEEDVAADGEIAELEDITEMFEDAAEIEPMDGGTIIEENLVFGKNYEIEKVDRGETAKYKFSLSESGRVTIKIKGDCVGGGAWEPSISIYNSADEKVWSYTLYDHESRECEWDLLAGDYIMYIGTTSLFLNAWAFNFTAHFEGSGETEAERWLTKNDSIETATNYPLGGTFNGYLADNEECDVYKTYIDKSGYLSMKVLSLIPGIKLQLLDSDGDVVNEYNDIKTGTYVYKTLVPKGTYYFKVCKGNCGKYTLSTSNNALSTVTVKSAKAKISTANKKIARSLYVNWKKVSGADGYQVQISNKSNFSSKKTYSYNKAKSSATVKNYKFAKGKKYYVRVREYKISDNGKKSYSEWSKVKTVKFSK